MQHRRSLHNKTHRKHDDGVVQRGPQPKSEPCALRRGVYSPEHLHLSHLLFLDGGKGGHVTAEEKSESVNRTSESDSLLLVFRIPSALIRRNH